MEVAGRVALRFTGGVHGGSHVHLTAVRADGTHLWVAGDGTASLERLVFDSAVAPTRAGRQRSFGLADLVQLPGPPTGETDIQGIAGTPGWLWVVGSHALVRRRPKPEHDEAKTVRRLGKLRRDPNRYVIVRLAVQLGVDRRPEPVRVSRDGRRSALVGAPGTETLVDLLRADTHLAPFLAIPAQDNGFDVHGLAAVGDRLFVGLRGPVLRGWAVVLEVAPVQDPTDPGRLALGIFPEGSRYRKHFLDLGGLGVRDLCADGDDLLVLAGPTMALSGPVRVHRWRDAATARSGQVVRPGDVPVETAVTYGDGGDHPGGITLLAADPREAHSAQPRLLVVYDNPAPDRQPWPDTVLADRLRIGPEPGAVEGPEPDDAEEPADVARIADQPADERDERDEIDEIDEPDGIDEPDQPDQPDGIGGGPDGTDRTERVPDDTDGAADGFPPDTDDRPAGTPAGRPGPAVEPDGTDEPNGHAARPDAADGVPVGYRR